MGGIETQVSGLVEMQKLQGHDVFVLTLTPGAEHEDVQRFPFKLPANLLWHPKGEKLVTQALKELKPDVVHLHFGAVSPFAWNGLRAVSRLDIPSVATVHSIWGKIARRFYASTARNWKSKTIFSSVSQTASEIVSKTLNRKVAIAHNGVDIKFWSNLQKSESNRIQIVSATRFASRKRIRPQILAIEQIVKILEMSSPQFTIAGTGPDFNYIKKLIEKKNLSKYVNLVGRLDKHQLRDLYSTADLFLQMSLLEAFGIAACEARASGLPVISRKGSGVSEFVQNGVSGYLESSDDEIVNRIVHLVNNRDELRELKNSSKINPPIQDWEHAASQIQSLYQQALKAV
jgi:glycosyltransferase involved in cell wall biosynthesis